jgi:hypothetical protein
VCVSNTIPGICKQQKFIPYSFGYRESKSKGLGSCKSLLDMASMVQGKRKKEKAKKTELALLTNLLGK